MEVNNFVSVDFQTQVFIMVLNIMKFSTRIISQKGGGGGRGGRYEKVIVPENISINI